MKTSFDKTRSNEGRGLGWSLDPGGSLGESRAASTVDPSGNAAVCGGANAADSYPGEQV